MLKRDFTQITKFSIDNSVATRPQKEPNTRDLHAVALSKLDASKCGKVQANALSVKKRKQIAKKAGKNGEIMRSQIQLYFSAFLKVPAKSPDLFALSPNHP